MSQRFSLGYSPLVYSVIMEKNENVQILADWMENNALNIEELHSEYTRSLEFAIWVQNRSLCTFFWEKGIKIGNAISSRMDPRNMDRSINVSDDFSDFLKNLLDQESNLHASGEQNEISEIVNTASKGSSSESASNLVEVQRVEVKDSSKQSV